MNIRSKGQGHKAKKNKKADQVAGVSYALYGVPSLSSLNYFYILISCGKLKLAPEHVSGSGNNPNNPRCSLRSRSRILLLPFYPIFMPLSRSFNFRACSAPQCLYWSLTPKSWSLMNSP